MVKSVIDMHTKFSRSTHKVASMCWSPTHYTEHLEGTHIPGNRYTSSLEYNLYTSIYCTMINFCSYNSIIQILTAHEGNGGKLLSWGETQPCLLFIEARRAEVNSRPRLSFNKGTIIFYHSPNKRVVNICFIHPIHRFFSPYRTVQSGK